MSKSDTLISQTAEKCEADDSTEGDGVCGVNGNEKVFGADQEASDCEGNLAGPYTQGGFTLDTTTTVRSPRQTIARREIMRISRHRRARRCSETTP